MQSPSGTYKSVTNLVIHFNSSNGVTTGDNDMLMNNTIGSDQRTNKDLPEQVCCPCTGQFVCRHCKAQGTEAEQHACQLQVRLSGGKAKSTRDRLMAPLPHAVPAGRFPLCLRVLATY